MWKVNSFSKDCHKPRILICDPKPHFRNMLHEYLASVGFNADQARTGQECLELVPVRHPDVILLEHELPQVNGVETLKKLRKMGITTPIILFSEDKIPAPDHDSAILPKPKRPKEIAIVLEVLLIETKKNKYFIPNRYKVH